MATQKGNVRFQKSFFPCFCIHSKAKYIFFPETCFAYPISEQKFTVWSVLICYRIGSRYWNFEICDTCRMPHVGRRNSYLDLFCNSFFINKQGSRYSRDLRRPRYSRKCEVTLRNSWVLGQPSCSKIPKDSKRIPKDSKEIPKDYKRIQKIKNPKD